MRTADALAHFHDSRSAIARALNIKRASVYAWGEYVPPLRAAQLQALTEGFLKFDPDKYRAWNQPSKKPRRRRARG